MSLRAAALVLGRRSNLHALMGDCFGQKCAALAMTWDIHKINRPSRLRRAIGFDLDYLSTSKASPNDTGIVIIIITIICEVVIEHLKVDYSIKLFILNFEIAGSQLK
jgi:hypothetical protein